MNTVEMIGRLLVSLAAVLGVMWLIARRARKGIVKGKSNRVIEVLDRASLTRGSSVAVVRVNDQAFVLGIAESQVSILGETDLDAALAAHEAAAHKPKAGARRAAKPVAHRSVIDRPAGPAAVASFSAPPAHRAPADMPVDPTAAVSRRASKPLTQPTRPTGPLAGSALSPQTWKQTIESLRDLTARP